MRPQNGRRGEQKAFKPLHDFLNLFLGHNTSAYTRKFGRSDQVSPAGHISSLQEFHNFIEFVLISLY
jgi:hypothetical protein